MGVQLKLIRPAVLGPYHSLSFLAAHHLASPLLREELFVSLTLVNRSAFRISTATQQAI